MERLDELLAFLSGFVTGERNKAFDNVLQQRTRYITVLLEDIYQPHNASAVLRSCECFGVQDVHIIEKRNPYRVSRDIALGSEKWLKVNTYSGKEFTTAEVYGMLRDQGYRIVATTPHEGDFTPAEFNLAGGRAVMVFGTELQGLSKEAVAEADHYMRIPMAGFTESFNVSVSAGIILYELTRRLRKENLDWHLTNDEIKELKLQWLTKSIKSSGLLIKEFYSNNFDNRQ
ncbi:MAG: RNA methyltransferase [Bacteroidales bacterium]|nr:RNA methyltransferase [Bacteroidales bacterium]